MEVVEPLTDDERALITQLIEKVKRYTHTPALLQGDEHRGLHMKSPIVLNGQ
jgi:hypothetical protein